MIKKEEQLLKDKVDLRNEVVRQDRIATEFLNAELKIDNISYSVIDCTAFGVAITSDQTFPIGIEIDGVFSLDTVTTQIMKLRTARADPCGESKYKIGFEIISEPLDITIIQAAHQTAEMLSKFKNSEKDINSIPRAFRQFTLELKEILVLLENDLQILEAKIQHTSAIETKKSFDASVRIIAQFLKENLDEQLNSLSDALGEVSSEQRKLCYSYFRDQVSSILNLAPFSHRSLNKPLGYAGDYEMMNMIYRDEPLGHTLFSRALHKYMINMSGGKAVRNRAHYLCEKIKAYFNKESSSRVQVKTLSVASGPAMEIQLLLQEFSQTQSTSDEVDLSKATFHFLDQDLSSLKYAQRTLGSLNKNLRHPAKLDFFNIDIKRVIIKGLPEQDYDLIYSAGLFDYFSEAVAIRAAEQLLKALKPGGQLIIGNFDITNPSRLFMELAWDWELIYRSELDLQSMYGHLGSEGYTESEPEKVNLFYVIRK